MSSASVSTRDEKSFIASRYSADATSTRRPGASKNRTALGSGPGRKPLTASFNQSGSSPSRSATVAAARRTESVGTKIASSHAWHAVRRSTTRSRPRRRGKAPPAARLHRVQMQVLRTTGGCHRRRAGLESYSTQSAGGDEDPPGAEGRRGLLKCGWVHPTQRRHEPPLGGVPPWLARPGGQRPVVTPSEVLRQCGECGIHLGGTRRRRLAIESLGCDRGTGSGKIM